MRFRSMKATGEPGLHKGVGETGTIPGAGAAAIANAVEDAVVHLGVTVREVPVTPAYLHARLSQARAAAR